MHLNDNIYDVIGVKKTAGPRVGIELEYEDWAGIVDDDKYWQIAHDGSLRNQGVEFVSIPLAMHQVRPALVYIDGVLKEWNPTANERCGVHVHLNMSDKTFNHLFTFTTLYALLEPALFKQYAPDRIDNHFCVPMFYNMSQMTALQDDIARLRAGKPFEKPKPKPKKKPKAGDQRHDDLQVMLMAYGRDGQYWQRYRRDHPARYREALDRARLQNIAAQHFGNDAINDIIMRAPKQRLEIAGTSKYSALNYGRLNDLGTVEFRMFGATKDIDEIEGMTKLVRAIQIEASGFGDPLEVIQKYEKEGLKYLCDRVGLRTPRGQKDLQWEAEDVAYFAAGFEPPKWDDLEWKLDEEEVA